VLQIYLNIQIFKYICHKYVFVHWWPAGREILVVQVTADVMELDHSSILPCIFYQSGMMVKAPQAGTTVLLLVRFAQLATRFVGMLVLGSARSMQRTTGGAQSQQDGAKRRRTERVNG